MVAAGVYLLVTGGNRTAAQTLLVIGMLYVVGALVAERLDRGP